MQSCRFLTTCIFALAWCGQAVAQSGTLTVKVRDKVTQEPLARAQVMLSTFGGGAGIHRAFTDESGAVTLSGVAAGGYYLEVALRGYVSARESLDMPRGATQSTEIELVPQPRETGQKQNRSPSSSEELAVPKQARKLFEEGVKKLDTHPEESAKLFQKAINIYPRFARSYAMLALSQYQLKEFENAAASSRHAIEIDPLLPMAHTLLGKVYMQQKNYPDAEVELLEGARLDPGSWEAPYQLARCYYNAGNLQRALEYGRHAHDTPGAPTSMHLLMVDLYSASHNRDAALKELDDFVKADPKSPYMSMVKQKREELTNK